MKICPFCAEDIQDAAIVCKHCGRDLVAAPVSSATVVTASTATRIVCEKCKVGTMSVGRVRRFSQGLVFIGYTLWVPAALFLAAMTYGAFSATSQLTAARPADAMVQGAGAVVILVTYAMGLPFLIVGLILTLRKNVWKCSGCGYVFDRA